MVVGSIKQSIPHTCTKHSLYVNIKLTLRVLDPALRYSWSWTVVMLRVLAGLLLSPQNIGMDGPT